ncbi:MAG: hypothetical protein BECKG1743D_GA0114223_109861 [Candidatus Kentron sp. G]|nr:MAG: hypothetical protein BECKG1743F_GA0114225_101103 [Candidatus Kentron sp. G]VFN03506.1 MAG: hypothetical protein BECKG1743E_GA0114224_106242 [Candidatus Kentron sp. G]VFN07120.1 MAG: hypothetical protein BECKG1743D_GA0114223_109861 [Candidatus Kentron sp. G]
MMAMSRLFTSLVLALVLIVPLAAYWLGNPFYLDVATRLVILVQLRLNSDTPYATQLRP